MRISVIAVAACLALGVAWAQQDKGNQKATPDSSKAASADKANTVETKTFKGTLVDASCSGNVTQTTPTAKTGQNTADRSDENKACGVSSGTKQFALRTKDGRVLRFDTVGNDRAADAIKNRKKWTDAASSGKAIDAKVSGTVEGDTLTVVSI